MITRITWIFFFVLAITVRGYTQKPDYKDSIDLVKIPFSGLKFYQHGKKLTMGQVGDMMRLNAEAFNYFNKAKTNNAASFIFGFIGGFLIGYELGTAIGGRDINWGVMGAGAGFAVITIPFESGFKRNARKAVSLYNTGFR